MSLTSLFAHSSKVLESQEVILKHIEGIKPLDVVQPTVPGQPPSFVEGFTKTGRDVLNNMVREVISALQNILPGDLQGIISSILTTLEVNRLEVGMNWCMLYERMMFYLLIIYFWNG